MITCCMHGLVKRKRELSIQNESQTIYFHFMKTTEILKEKYNGLKSTFLVISWIFFSNPRKLIKPFFSSFHYVINTMLKMFWHLTNEFREADLERLYTFTKSDFSITAGTRRVQVYLFHFYSI